MGEGRSLRVSQGVPRQIQGDNMQLKGTLEQLQNARVKHTRPHDTHLADRPTYTQETEA